MKTVLDTNTFVESLSRTSPHHAIFQHLLRGNFSICVSTPILLEYEEILFLFHRKENVERLLSFLAHSPFAIFIDPTYRFNLIAADPDDNKFVDCAIAAASDYIVTSDHHYDILKRIGFPKVEIITPQQFTELLATLELGI